MLAVQRTIAICVLLTTLSQCAWAASPPNFLIILADDLGFSDIGCYGGEISTPNLDALAARGLRYTQFYNTARCWPTRAALLTGYYAQQVGFDTMPDFKNPDPRHRPPWARLISEYLRELGYRNYHSGKWHLDSTPLKSAFDRSYVLLDYDRNFSPRNHTLDSRRLPPVKLGEEYYSTTAIADRAIEFLQEHDAKHRDRSFFAYVAFTVPHFPLHAPPDDIARYTDRYKVGWDTIRSERWKRIQQKLQLPCQLSSLEPKTGTPYLSERARNVFGDAEVWLETSWDKLSDDQRKHQIQKMAVHAAMVECMDREIGRIISQLHAMGADKNTLVLFLSDNGASAEIAMRGDLHDPKAPPGSAATFLSLGPGWSNAANTPFRRHKIWVHEGGIATPLIAHWPAGISSTDQLRHAVGHVIDITPTILRLAGGELQREFEGTKLPPSPGRDLSPTFNDDRPIDRDCLWWLHERNRAIRKGDWKLVAARGEKWELYDLAKDRAENNDLAATHPEKAKKLADLWQSRLNEFQELARKNVGEK